MTAENVPTLEDVELLTKQQVLSDKAQSGVLSRWCFALLAAARRQQDEIDAVEMRVWGMLVGNLHAIADRGDSLASTLDAVGACKCACHFEKGRLVTECHYHQCNRSILLPNGDPSKVTWEMMAATLQRRVESLTAELAEAFPGSKWADEWRKIREAG